MVKYIIMGFIFSAALTSEALFCSHLVSEVLVPDLGLMLILAYCLRGQGKIAAPLSFLCGWIKGVSVQAPAGFYILIYFLLAQLLFKIRSVFFTERPLSQFFLCFCCSMLYWFLQTMCRLAGILPEPVPGMIVQQMYACLVTAALAPVFFPLYDRCKRIRKRLHP